MIHQFVKHKETTLCGIPKDEVNGTHYCDHVTCVDCLIQVEKLVDEVFKPLED